MTDAATAICQCTGAHSMSQGNAPAFVGLEETPLPSNAAWTRASHYQLDDRASRKGGPAVPRAQAGNGRFPVAPQ